MANIERVKAVVEHIEKQLAWQKNQPVVTNLLSFYMGDWFVETKNAAGEVCGTSMCLAGWAAHFAQAGMIRWQNPEWGSWEVVVPGGSYDGYNVTPIEVWAAEYFGFTPTEVEIFYYTGIQSLDELKASLNYVLEEEVFEGVPHFYDF